MDHYKIGVSILLRDGMSPVLSAISGKLLGVHKSVKEIEGGMNRWKLAIGGAAMVAGGAGLLGALTKVAEKGNAIVHQMELMKALGLSHKQIAEATAKSYAVSASTPVTTIAENMKHLRELRYAFGHLSTAQQYLEPVARANAILNSVKGGGNDQVWELVKGLEEKGVTTNPAEFSRYVDIMTKAVIGSGGRVTPQSFFSAFKYGRVATLGWDETFVGQYLPRLIQSWSGGGSGGGGSGGPGNALMSAFAKVVQGQMPKKAAEEFHRLGLTTSYSRIHGSSKSNADIVGSGLFTKNPYEWVQLVLMPALTKAGVTSEKDIIQEVSRLMPVRTAAAVIAQMALQGRFREGENSPFEKDARINRGAMSAKPAYNELAANDPVLVERAFHKQFENMLEALGKAANPTYLAALRALTGFFTSVTQFSAAHAAAITAIAKGLAVLGVALIGAGAAAIIAAIGIGGWIVGGIAAIGVAISMLPKGVLMEIGRDLRTIGSAAAYAIKPLQWLASAIRSLASLGGFMGGGKGGGTGIIPGAEGMPALPGVHPPLQKQGYNAVPPGAGGGKPGSKGDIYMDGRKVGEIVTRHQSVAANGPLQGSAYYDGSATWIPADYSFARG